MTIPAKLTIAKGEVVVIAFIILYVVVIKNEMWTSATKYPISMITSNFSTITKPQDHAGLAFVSQLTT